MGVPSSSSSSFFMMRPAQWPSPGRSLAALGVVDALFETKESNTMKRPAIPSSPTKSPRKLNISQIDKDIVRAAALSRLFSTIREPATSFASSSSDSEVEPAKPPIVQFGDIGTDSDGPPTPIAEPIAAISTKRLIDIEEVPDENRDELDASSSSAKRARRGPSIHPPALTDSTDVPTDNLPVLPPAGVASVDQHQQPILPPASAIHPPSNGDLHPSPPSSLTPVNATTLPATATPRHTLSPTTTTTTQAARPPPPVPRTSTRRPLVSPPQDPPRTPLFRGAQRARIERERTERSRPSSRLPPRAPLQDLSRAEEERRRFRAEELRNRNGGTPDPKKEAEEKKRKEEQERAWKQAMFDAAGPYTPQQIWDLRDMDVKVEARHLVQRRIAGACRYGQRRCF
ncbi:hypothetical protein HDU96_001396 [Phlyctochytrium bullatum]|nr:hypothetical protein HDU96_001396 [Phlyctochytrium bullatum]